jgi:predicted ATPase
MAIVEHNLPAERIRPIGREHAAAAVAALLRDPAVPAVTLLGPGGMGKTTLAIHVAYELLYEFDSVTFVDLTPLADPGLIPGQIARAAGLEETPGLPVADVLADHYRDRHALLLLDNCEHVLDGALLVADLLRGCPRLVVLATSREPLRLRHERVYPLAPLALPPPHAGLDALAHVAAVELFVQRARGVRPGFALSAENAAAVAAIVARLDGLPLAIELAAARVRLFPPAILRQRLEASPLGVLTGGARDLPARQQTIGDTIAWSVDLLEPAEARLFRRLGVFANGFTAEAAAAVAADAFQDEAIDALVDLESLLDKSLVFRLPGDGEPRFGLLETLRAYALEQLAAVGEMETARRAHFDHYLALAEAAIPYYLSASHVECMRRMAAEDDNLRAALDWSLELARTCSGGHAPAVRLAGALSDYWNYGNH